MNENNEHRIVVNPHNSDYNNNNNNDNNKNNNAEVVRMSTTIPVTEDASGWIDIENNATTSVDDATPRRRKAIGLVGAFILVALALTIGLSITLGRGKSASSGSIDLLLAISDSNSSTTVVADTVSPPSKEPKDEVTASTPTQVARQYISSVGPIDSRLRIIDPSVADGYESCTDLREDILNAVKYLANSIIVVESVPNEWYERCDPNAPSTPVYPYYGDGIALAMDGGGDTAAKAESAPASDADGAASTLSTKEDSFGTNNQVDGVDEADVVKSDGDFVYAAYGDLLYVWNATDGTKGVSITAMPYEVVNLTECININLPYMPEPRPFVSTEASEEDNVFSTDSSAIDLNTTVPVVVKAKSNERKLSMIWNPCVQPKPTILSLLLQGNRLTAIVSEQALWYYGMQTESKPKIIGGDSSKLFIRVYDLTEVPTDGRPLTLLGERVINGAFNSARSVGSIAHLFSTSYVDTAQFTNELYRWAPQYCGLNSTEYEKLATKTALNNTESFVDQMMEELQLHTGDSCESIFQVAAMQSGESNIDSTYGNVLGSFVQVLSFDMSADFNNDNTPPTGVAEIFANVGGTFSSGWVSSVYTSQDFAATLSVGSSYNNSTGQWDELTFVLGFDISGATPKPFSYAELPGSPLNQYSVDLYQGHLRVVTTKFFWNETTSSTTNKIFVLKVPETEGDSPEMLLIGETGHLGKPNEQVMSVRFMESKVYVVTFERIDPLYVFDLTDPSKPKKEGELEVPGFSSYLHPIEIEGVQLMLGIGSHVNETTGWESGLKISLYDVSNPMNLKEVAVLVDDGASSSGSWDFKSFRYLPQSQKLILAKSEYTWTEAGNFDGFVVYDITLKSIQPSYSIQHASSYDMNYGCWYDAYLPPRSFVFQSKLTTILSHSVISTDLENGKRLWNLTLKGLNDTVCSPYFF